MDYTPTYIMQARDDEWLDNRLAEKEPEGLIGAIEAYLQQTCYYSSKDGWKNLHRQPAQSTDPSSIQASRSSSMTY